MLRTAMTLGFMIAFIMPAFVSAGDWAMWRGPRADGINDNYQGPLTWSASKNVAWKAQIPGIGYSSPIVFKQSIFLTTAIPENKERRLLKIDRTTGNIVWSKVVVVADIERMHRLNSPASATPATDGKHVFVAFQNVDELLVAAYSFDGELIWKISAGSFESRHGFNTALVVFEESVLVSGLQDGEGAFVARLDSRTGEIIWKTPIDDPVRSFSAPFVFKNGDDTQIVLSGANRTFSFEPDDGKIRWFIDGPAQKTVSSVVSDGTHLFVSGGRENMLYAVSASNVAEASESRIRWKATKGIPYINSPIYYRDHLHVVSDDGIYTKVHPSTGNILLQKRLTTRCSSSPIGTADKILVTNENGDTLLVNSDEDAEVEHVNSIGEPVFASIALTDDELYIRGTKHLYKIAKSSQSN